MIHQALFSLKDKSKKKIIIIKMCRQLQFLFGALRVKDSPEQFRDNFSYFSVKIYIMIPTLEPSRQGPTLLAFYLHRLDSFLHCKNNLPYLFGYKTELSLL